jgi:hypothetical protein
MMMIGIGLVGYEESRPLKAAIGARIVIAGFQHPTHGGRPQFRPALTPITSSAG